MDDVTAPLKGSQNILIAPWCLAAAKVISPSPSHVSRWGQTKEIIKVDV